MHGKKTAFLRFTSAAVLLVWLMMLLPVMAFADEADPTKAREAMNGVVRVLNFFDNSVASGSGFLVGKPGQPSRYLVTNWHVIVDSRGGFNGEIYVILDDDTFEIVNQGNKNDFSLKKQKAIRCEVLGSPKQYPDFAILKAERNIPNRVALPLAPMKSVQPLDTVYALGFPGVSDESVLDLMNVGVGRELRFLASLDSMTCTAGRVMRITKNEMFGGLDYICSETKIRHGSSGGPQVNKNGAVIGLNTYSINEYYLEETMDEAWIVPIDHVIKELDRLGIPYEISNPSPEWILPAVVVVLVLAIVAVAFVLIYRTILKQRLKMMDYSRRIHDLSAVLKKQNEEDAPAPAPADETPIHNPDGERVPEPDVPREPKVREKMNGFGAPKNVLPKEPSAPIVGEPVSEPAEDIPEPPVKVPSPVKGGLSSPGKLGSRHEKPDAAPGKPDAVPEKPDAAHGKLGTPRGVLGAVPPAKKPDDAPAPKEPAGEAKKDDNGFRLVGVAGPHTGKRFAMNSAVTIGTEKEKNTHVIADKSFGVSRRHCELRVKNGKLYITDLGSSNGTFVNGDRIEAERPMELFPGDSIFLATSRVCYRIDVSHKLKAKS